MATVAMAKSPTATTVLASEEAQGTGEGQVAGEAEGQLVGTLAFPQV